MGSVRLRVVVRGLSPLIVRTLDVPGSATLDVVHEALLVCFGWSGECLHEFTIRAAGYSSDWMVDACDTRDVTIDSLGLRVGERFTWRYDFLAGWVIDLRVEAVTGDELAMIRCVSGRRAGPPEWCGGPAGFQAWEDSHSLLEFLECIGELRDGVDAYGAPVDPGCLEDRLVALARWVGRVRFGKAVVDRRLTVLEVRPCVSLSRSG